MRDEIMKLVRDKVALILNKKLTGKVTVIYQNEDLIIMVENYAFLFNYVYYDVYWAVHYGVSADIIVEDFILHYKKQIQRRFFK